MRELIVLWKSAKSDHVTVSAVFSGCIHTLIIIHNQSTIV